jgi:hypothetical protein
MELGSAKYLLKSNFDNSNQSNVQYRHYFIGAPETSFISSKK